MPQCQKPDTVGASGSYSVITKPALSEKSTALRETEGKYTFYVRREATKLDVKTAIEKMYDVKVASVNTCVIRGKIKRRKQREFKLQNTKKAVVQLAAGQKIGLFEEV